MLRRFNFWKKIVLNRYWRKKWVSQLKIQKKRLNPRNQLNNFEIVLRKMTGVDGKAVSYLGLLKIG